MKTPSYLAKFLPVLGILVLFMWHGWLTISLFGVERPFTKLFDDTPIVHGSHPLHQYHGHLGVRSILYRGTVSCYDPAFQAGYPKTPVFDDGSRPAELFFLLSTQRYSPRAYKFGFLIVILLVPCLLLSAAKGIGLSWWPTFWALVFGLLVWWGTPSQACLRDGNLDLLLSGLIITAHVGALIRYDRAPSFGGWVGVGVTSALGWFAHPLLFPFVIPLFMIYYLSAGVRHRSLGWHVSLLCAQVGGLVINSLWLYEWLLNWWIRSPMPTGREPIVFDNFEQFWETNLWGGCGDRTLALMIYAAGLLGVVLFNQRTQRATARLLGFGSGLFLLLALRGMNWEPLAGVETSRLIVSSLWLASLAAAHGFHQSYWLFRILARNVYFRAAVLLVVGILVVTFANTEVSALAWQSLRARPIETGLNVDRQHIIDVLKKYTDQSARILWEDQRVRNASSGWTALLPLLTERSYIGGLDPHGIIEHSHSGFVRGALAGTPLPQWTDEALAKYCSRYNVGWVVVWSPAGLERFSQWKGADLLVTIKDGKTGYLFRIRAPERTFTIHGKAIFVRGDEHHLTFREVIPENGKVVLSFHYQSGMRASPSSVIVEREPDPTDTIPLLRLRTEQPVSHVTIYWDTR
ncbi:MAG: hypothetical protein ACFCD0_21820 [Gemmataceae bacterium]